MPKFEDLTGQKFGRLTVIKRAPNKNGRTAWYCQCECGNEKIVISKSLKDGNTKSCGCYHKEIVHKQFCKDITNQRFGNLIALEPTKERKHGSIVWKCLCDCGNYHYATTELLLGGKVQSCGCIHSRGNQKINNILQQSDYIFSKEYFVSINNIRYAFDFVIFDNDKIKCFIEYDGILHFKQDSYHGWNNSKNWEKTQLNDKIKNNYCKQNNIPLIRIPYTDFDKINLEYLQKRIEKI